MTGRGFGVCPHDVARGLERWAFLNTFVNKALGLGSRFGIYLDFVEFAAALEGEEFLWGFLNPADYLKARTLFGYEAIARPAGIRDVAYVVARTGEPLAGSIEAFAGRRVALVRGYLAALVRHRLQGAGVSCEVVAVKSYAEVMKTVGRGDADFGVTYNDHFDRLSAAVRDDFRVEARVDPGLAHVVAAHPSIPQPGRAALRELLLGAHLDSAGAGLLATLGFTAFEEVPEGPYRDLADVLEAVR